MHRSIKRPGLSRCGHALIAAAALCVAAAQAVVPTPTVTGPIPGDTPGSPSRNYTYWATDIVLKNFGFVENLHLFDFLVLDGGLHHAQHTEAKRVFASHGVGHVRLNCFLQGHFIYRARCSNRGSPANFPAET